MKLFDICIEHVYPWCWKCTTTWFLMILALCNKYNLITGFEPWWLSLSNSYGLIPTIFQSMSIPITPVPSTAFISWDGMTSHWLSKSDFRKILKICSRKLTTSPPEKRPSLKTEMIQLPTIHLSIVRFASGCEWWLDLCWRLCWRGAALEKNRQLDLWLTDFWNERQWFWKSMYQMKLPVIIKIGLFWFDLILSVSSSSMFMMCVSEETQCDLYDSISITSWICFEEAIYNDLTWAEPLKVRMEKVLLDGGIPPNMPFVQDGELLEIDLLNCRADSLCSLQSLVF